MKAPSIPLWRMTRTRYDRLVDAGIFSKEDRVELLDGLLVAREPQGSLHAMAVGLARVALQRAFGKGYHAPPLILVPEVARMGPRAATAPAR